MRRTWKIVLTPIAAAALGIGTMTTVHATGIGMGPGGGCTMAGQGMADPDRMNRHLAMMKNDLNIGPVQEAAWAAFAQTLKQQKTEMMSATQQVGDAKSAPDRIGERLRLMKRRVAGMETMVAAMDRLYAVLTQRQKEILDSRFVRGMPM